LRVSIGSRRKSVPFSSSRSKAYKNTWRPALATKPLEHREPILVAGHGLAVDQARADLEPVYGFADERIVR
jgi:hypothetical protein